MTAPVAVPRTAGTTDLWRMSARELAEAIRTRRVSSREVIESHLARIEAVNPSLNAVTILLAGEARAAADAADQAVVEGDALGPFHGVPFTAKSNIDLLGTPTTQGLKLLATAFPSEDAPVAARMRAAGAIPIGRTNLPTIAVRWHTESELWGATVNPWDPTRTPGGSSGGEAVALATGMSPLGLGNDGLGSLRWPAQCCGVAALKPTLGRIPHASSLEPADGPIGLQLCTVEGPMARRVGDLRAAFEVLAGPSWRDPWSVPAPLQGAPLHRPIRVALVTDPAGQGTTPQVRDALRKAADGLAGAGYAVDDIEPPGIADAAQVLLDMLNTTDVHALDDRMSGFLPPPTRQFLAAFYEVAGDRDQVRIMTAFTTRQALLRRWGEFQEERPLILAPISTDLPFEVGRDLALEEVAATIRGMRMAMAVNALGLPAVAVPVGVAEGLPQVIQIIGPRYREDLCLDAAEALEEAFGAITPIDPAGGTIS